MITILVTSILTLVSRYGPSTLKGYYYTKKGFTIAKADIVFRDLDNK
jgi:hypothetical protein